MKDFVHTLHAEILKLRRTLALWLALIAPAVVIALQVMMVWSRADYYRVNPPADIWGEYAMQILVLWGLLMQPLFVTLETALVANLEHRGAQWKHLFALPVKRGALYTAKLLAGMALIALSLLALGAYTVGSGLALRHLLPGTGFEAAAPLYDIFSFVAFLFVGSWLLIALQTWIAQRWASFAVASGVGIALTVMGAMVIQSKYVGYYPTTLPILVANGFNATIQPLNILEGGRPVKELLLGSLGGLLFAAASGWRFARRDVL